MGNICYAWGTKSHEIISKAAIEILPDEIKPFYDANLRQIVVLSTLPDDWRLTYKDTGKQHYCDIDMLSKPPFTDLILSYKDAEIKYGKEQLEKAGLLPWVVIERYEMLVEAMKRKDHVEIVVQSAVLSHFIGDMHMPMHTTKDYDGVKPEHKGVHFRWEEPLAEMYMAIEKMKVIKPAIVGDITKTIFEWLIDSYSYNEKIFKAEDDAINVDPNHSFKYFKVLWDRSGDIMKSQMSKSSEAVAGIWIAAWNAAGKPRLGDKTAPLFWGK